MSLWQSSFMKPEAPCARRHRGGAMSKCISVGACRHSSRSLSNAQNRQQHWPAPPWIRTSSLSWTQDWRSSAFHGAGRQVPCSSCRSHTSQAARAGCHDWPARWASSGQLRRQDLRVTRRPPLLSAQVFGTIHRRSPQFRTGPNQADADGRFGRYWAWIARKAPKDTKKERDLPNSTHTPHERTCSIRHWCEVPPARGPCAPRCGCVRCRPVVPDLRQWHSKRRRAG